MPLHLYVHVFLLQQQSMLPEMFQLQLQALGNNVVFPVVDTILAVLFFVKIGTAYFDYRKHGQFEFAAPAILFACLIFTLTAPLYIWGIVGM